MMIMDTNDDDLEVATVLAQGLGSVSESKSPTSGRQSNYSHRRNNLLFLAERLHQLAAKGELIAVKELVREDGHINELDEQSLTPLMWAAVYGQTDVVTFLVQAGANTEIYNDEGITALMLACFHGNNGVVKVLVESGVDVDQVDVEGNSALLYAVFGDQVECTRLLLEKGVDLTQRNLQGISAMDAAVKLHHRNVQKCIEAYLVRCLSGS
ncbi:hypothetical protein LSH36_60g03040 [Paralvinella palmiformis]|uniref:Uncharacterized protein n=1 Tax=Paralvinella palmiformis TaxID=53620 RepID=A0AAD9NBZ4_9ANNE|nr:hypothetical protein LSH36_60g03040 [Paralvinella palmiformis]